MMCSRYRIVIFCASPSYGVGQENEIATQAGLPAILVTADRTAAVREAANAEDGLAALEDEAPDVILLDVMMPQVDGWEMLRRVQERHGVGSIPVVMFSGQLDAGNEAAERGAQGFVGKPFDLRALIEQTKQIVPA